MNYASFRRRFLAKIIDWLFYYPFLFLNSYYSKSNNKETFLAILFSITIITLVYNILFVYIFGKTLGKMILQIRVVKPDGGKVGIKNAVFREIFAIISFFILIVQHCQPIGDLKYIGNISNVFSGLSILENIPFFLTDDCRTVHDFIANTIVISEVKYS